MQLLEIPPQTPISEIDEEVLEIFVEEMDEVLEEMLSSYNSWKHDPTETEALKTLRRHFHTLKDNGRLVGATVIGELGWRFENMLNRIIEGTFLANEKVFFLLDQVKNVLPDLIERFKNNQSAPNNALQLTSQADHLTQTKGENLGEFDPPREDEFMAIFLDEAEEILENTQSLLERWQAAPDNMQLMQELQRVLHALKGGARIVGITAMGDLSHQLESVLTRIIEGNAHASAKLQEIVQNSVDELVVMLEAARSSVPLEMPTELIQQISAALVVESQESDQPATVIKKPTPVKMTESREPPQKDEAEEILENIQLLLERWQAAPNNMQLMRELQRNLHTLEGGARMVSMMPMGNLSHQLESALMRIVERLENINNSLTKTIRTR